MHACFNPEAAERDAAARARMIARLTELIQDSDTLSTDKRAELRGVISTKPGLNRYLRVTPGGLLRIWTGPDGLPILTVEAAGSCPIAHVYQ
jgi:hypothetical protein